MALVNRLERERGRELRNMHDGLATLLKLTIRVSHVTWDSIRFLCTTSGDSPGRRQEFATAVPPLSRTILDSLFTVIFIFDDPVRNAAQYFKSGWRESHEDHLRLCHRHGTDPEWRHWLPRHARKVRGLGKDAGITATEKRNPRIVDRWPNPGRMASQTKDARRRAFLQFLSDWFYKQLSRDAHLSYQGLVHRASHLSDPARSDIGRERLQLYKWEVILTSICMYTALLSEIAGQFGFDYEGRRLHDAWKVLGKWPDAADLYKERYQAWLPT